MKKTTERPNLGLKIKVHPGAKVTAWTGVLADGTLKLDIRAKAEKGKANSELLAFLAKDWGVAKERIEIKSGLSSRLKLIRIKD